MKRQHPPPQERRTTRVGARGLIYPRALSLTALHLPPTCLGHAGHIKKWKPLKSCARD
ncbi:MAG: hypothetical protein ABSC57_02635 [Syntrophales bacterium]